MGDLNAKILCPHTETAVSGDDAATFRKGAVGAATGILTSDITKAKMLKKEGKKVIFLIDDYVPEHTHQITDMDGLVVKGKGASHLAILCQNFAIPAVFGLDGGEIPREGDEVTISRFPQWNLTKGGVAIKPPDAEYFQEITKDADAKRRQHPNGIKVFANASSAKEIERAIALGAEGIGLVRTEFFIRDNADLKTIKELLLTKRRPNQKILDSFEETQYWESRKLFAAANKKNGGLPMLVRLFDPPYDELLDDAARKNFETSHPDEMDTRRGVQWAETLSGLYKAQVRAILDAAKDEGYRGALTLMVPHVESQEEMQQVRDILGETNHRVKLFAVIESYKGAREARKIASMADGILVAASDLTAEVIGCDRSNEQGIKDWMDKNNAPNPFQSLSQPVCAVIETIVSEARKTNPHMLFTTPSAQVAGDAKSIGFCNGQGFDSVSVPATHECIASTKFLASVMDKASQEMRKALHVENNVSQNVR